MAELRAEVLRDDLLRLGRFDEVRVRTRFLDAYSPEATRVVVFGAEVAGLVSLRPAGDTVWIEHFYVGPHVQGRGVGGGVLKVLLSEIDTSGLVARLNVLQGSAARRLYERHGFVVEREDAVDVFMVRPSTAAPSGADVAQA